MQSLNWMRQRTGSQCSWTNPGVTCSRSPSSKISRTAAFWTSCSGSSVVSGTPARIALSYDTLGFEFSHTSPRRGNQLAVTTNAVASVELLSPVLDLPGCVLRSHITRCSRNDAILSWLLLLPILQQCSLNSSNALTTAVAMRNSTATLWNHRIDFLTGEWYHAIWSETSTPCLIEL